MYWNIVYRMQVWPVNHFPEQEINNASNRLVTQHATAFPTERILLQVCCVWKCYAVLTLIRQTYNNSLSFNQGSLVWRLPY